MTYVEKLNAITRFIIYGSIVLFVLRGDPLVFLIPVVTMVVMYFLVTWGLGMEKLKEDFGIKEYTKSCQVPTMNNPFMNVLMTDPPSRDGACKYTETTKEQIESAFNSNLYQDVNDVYGRNNSQRQYYTMPATTVPNDQEKFANWLYKTEPTCKEGIC